MFIAKYKLLVTLLGLLIIPMIIGDFIPAEVKSFFYALSLTIKDILVLLLPFIIFSFLLDSLISLKERAVLFIRLLLSMVALSNFLAITTGYTIGSTLLPILNLKLSVAPTSGLLQPLWRVSIPKLISNEPAIISGVIIGTYYALRPNNRVTNLAKELSNISAKFLRKCFLPILPIFILGFILKLEYEDVLSRLLNTYGIVLLLVVTTQFWYICFLYFVASGLQYKKTLNYLKNIFPATITGLSTISSAATMPVTIVCTEKNLQNPTFARMIVPATANIHTIGSAIGLTILALATLNAYNLPIPNTFTFFTFAMYYTLAKFGVAGIPGGVIIVVTPLLETYLGFNPEMIGLITAVYLLFDPFGTATNVTGNGFFAIFFSKIYKSSNLIEEPRKIKGAI